MATKSIAHYGKAPQSHNYFQLSIEEISPQLTPLIIFNRITTIRTKIDNMKTAVNYNSNLVTDDKITPDEVAAEASADRHH